MNTKWWLKSKTEIAALIAAAATIAQVITGTTLIDQQLQTGIVIAIMFVLRFFTNKGITLKK